MFHFTFIDCFWDDLYYIIKAATWMLLGLFVIHTFVSTYNREQALHGNTEPVSIESTMKELKELTTDGETESPSKRISSMNFTEYAEYLDSLK
jgi:hypothetical protein